MTDQIARSARAQCIRVLGFFRSPEERIGITVLLTALSLIVAQSAFAHEFKLGDLEIVHPWSRATPPGATVGAGYFIVNNHGTSPDRLVSATAEVAGEAQLHEMAVKDGVMTMKPLPDGLEIPAGGSVALKPGSFHLMLTDLKTPLKEGTQFHGTLTFEKSGTVEVHFVVEGIGSTEPAGGGDMNMGQ